jgi:beta-glucosidase
MRDWLKTELGWDGFIVSDWGSVQQLIGHGVAADDQEAAERAFNAGVDMEMVTPCYADHLEALLDEGRVSREFLDDAVKRVLRGKFRAGLFERPYCEPEKSEEAQRRPEAIATAVKLAEQSLVLLKNQDEILPLPREDRSIAILGPYADAKRQCMGTWVLDGRQDEVTSILEGIEAVAPDLDVITANPAFTDECIHAAVRADLAVLCLGESHERTGENQCISSLVLPPGQEELIREIGKRGIPLVVVLCNGRPIPSPAAEQFADAIVQAWQGGTEMGTAVARVLFGESNFSGKLPVTMPRNTGQIPIYYNRKFPGKLMDMNAEQVAYKDESWEPLYPFGYGLSYTEFAYGNLRIDREKLGVEDLPARVTVEVENIGEVAGEEVVQLYLQDPVAGTARPTRELKGFQRITLEPGEKQTVSFELTSRHLEFYNAERRWAVEPGEFRVWIGGDSQAALGARFWVE